MLSITQGPNPSQKQTPLKPSRGNGFGEVAHTYGGKLRPIQGGRVATRHPEGLLTPQSVKEQNPAIARALGTRAINTEREGPEE